jgi:hypothetical protein
MAFLFLTENQTLRTVHDDMYSALTTEYVFTLTFILSLTGRGKKEMF